MGALPDADEESVEADSRAGIASEICMRFSRVGLLSEGGRVISVPGMREIETGRIEALAAVRAAVRSGLAERIRREAGVSRGEIAEAIGVSYDAVRLWELGLRVPQGAAARRYGLLLRRLLDFPGSAEEGSRR